MAHVVKSAVVAVTIGSPGGNGLVRFVEAGSLLPEGVDQEIVDHLVSTGLVEEVVFEPEADEPEGDEESEGDPVSLDDMKLDELRAHAASRGIDLGDAARKDDIRAVIDAAS